SPCVNGVVRTFILHESGHEPFVFLFPEGVALFVAG
ncbi:hypothetical protein PPOP_3320, partial [Paenibacillus popilliae ATCC 14706]